MTSPLHTLAGLDPTLDERLVRLAQADGAAPEVRVVSSPLLAALRRAGTSHIYADTADPQALVAGQGPDEGGLLQEVDGNTVNQPLVHKVLDRYLTALAGERLLRELRTGGKPEVVRWLLYTVLTARIGNDMVHTAALGRPWDVSLQLHMALMHDPDSAKAAGRLLDRMVPGVLVKVPFTPHLPDCFLVARDLERDGIPVNFTSTFSARQAVAAALLADVSRTNIFMGRIDQGLNACLLGAQIDLDAQRQLLALRRRLGIKTLLIVASLRQWSSFLHTAGCDVYTAPLPVLREFLQQTDVQPEAIESRLETSYEGRLGLPPEIERKVGGNRIRDLFRVDPAFVEFLEGYRTSLEYQHLQDGERLARRFEEAGFSDFFYPPSPQEWEGLRRSKLPDLDAPLTARLPLDTLYSLLADADFEKYQEEMDGLIAARLTA